MLVLLGLTLAGCMSNAKRLGLSEAEWQAMPKTKQAKLLADYYRVNNHLGRTKRRYRHHDGPSLQVAIREGTVAVWPYKVRQAYQPLNFAIHQHQCIQVPVTTSAGNTELGVCYYGHILHLDPSKYEADKEEGSLQFFRNSLWQAGFDYQPIKSTGYVRFDQAHMTVRANG